jgi:hypothetical protein
MKKFTVTVAIFCCLALAIPSVAFSGAASSATAISSTTATQGQAQYQGQGQTQGVNFSPAITPIQNQANNQVLLQEFNTPEEQRIETTQKGVRNYAFPAYIGFPQGLQYNQQVPESGENLMGLKTITAFSDVFTAEEIENLVATSDKGIRVKVRRLATVATDDEGAAIASSKVTVYTAIDSAKSAGEYRVLAFITARGLKPENHSVSAVAAALKAAMAIGADAVVGAGEGSYKELKSFGWGVGLSWNTATMSKGNNLSNVGSGGTGISGAKASYLQFPYIQLIALQKK